MPELVLKLGDNVIQTYVFDKEIMSIGRSRDNDVVIENLSVSRNHCRVRHQGEKFVLTDLNSANGTYVNGVKVTKTEIVDGDVLSVGKHKLQFMNRVLSHEPPVPESFGEDRTMLVDRIAQAILVITDGRLKGTEFQLTRFETSIGKAQDNDIVIGDDWFLSKKQALIYKRGVEFEIHDLGGFRKTKVNSQQLNEPYLLKTGDVLELGNTRCVFKYAGEAAPSGRVPEEMKPEDSVFSSSSSPGVGDSRFPSTPSTSRDESGESYGVIVEGASRPAAPFPDTQNGNGSYSQAPLPPSPSEEAAEAPAEAVDAPAGGASHRRRKRERSREKAGAALQQSAAADGGSVYGTAEAPDAPPVSPEAEADIPPPAEAAPVEPYHPDSSLESSPPEMASPDREDAAEPETVGAPIDEPQAPKESVPGAWSGGMSAEEIAAIPDLHREVSLWEQALDNRSSVIRRQAAKTLKKLTGRDYEI